MTGHSVTTAGLMAVESCVNCGSDAQPLRRICVHCLGELVEAAERKPERPMPYLLTVAEAARFLNVNAKTVRRLITAGELAAIAVGTATTPTGRRYRIRLRELKRFVTGRGEAPADT